MGNYSVPTDILGGKSAVVSVSFEIPNSVTPASLAYDDGLGDSCKANFASVWNANSDHASRLSAPERGLLCSHVQRQRVHHTFGGGQVHQRDSNDHQ